MDKVFWSFCIPSYNRAEATRKTVLSILEYDTKDIEVVVVDNCSSDNTVELIENIGDSRIRCVVNEMNLGAAGNFLESLKHAEGEYLFVLLSRETINADKIGEMTEYVKENSPVMMYCGEDNIDKDNILMPKGKKSLEKLAYRGLHPTGFVFKREEIVQILQRYNPKFAYDVFGYFPHDFLAAEMALKGNCVLYNKKIRNRVSKEYLTNSKSAMKEPVADVWFLPEERIKQFEKYVHHLESLEIDDQVFNSILVRTYMGQLMYATFLYKEYRSDAITCAHYNIPTRIVTVKEMADTYRLMRKKVKSYLSDSKKTISFTSRMLFCFSGSLCLARRIMHHMKKKIRKGKI